MTGICSAHMGPEPVPGCDLCTRNPDRCDTCGEPMRVGDEVYFKEDMTTFWHARCLPTFDPGRHFRGRLQKPEQP